MRKRRNEQKETKIIAKGSILKKALLSCELGKSLANEEKKIFFSITMPLTSDYIYKVDAHPY